MIAVSTADLDFAGRNGVFFLATMLMLLLLIGLDAMGSYFYPNAGIRGLIPFGDGSRGTLIDDKIPTIRIRRN